MTVAAKRDVYATRSARPADFVVTTLCIFLVLLFVYVLPPPYPVREGVDSSWQVALTNAFLDGVQFGRDFVFTYGPWGFIAEPRGDPRIYPWLVLTRFLIAAGVASGIAFIGVTRIPFRIARWTWIGVLLLLAVPTAVAPMLLFIISTHIKYDQRRMSYFTLALLVLSCALVLWVKFTFCIIVVALCCLSAVQDFLRRKLPLVAISTTAASFGFWILARQSVLNLPEYFRNSLYVAESYSNAMAWDGPRWQILWGALICICTVIAYAVVVGKDWKLLLGAAWVCLFCFLCFKQAFGRQDEYHIWLGLIDGLLPGALILLAGAGLFDRTRISLPGRRTTLPVLAVPVISCVLLPNIELTTYAGRERVQDLAWKIRATLSQRTPSRRMMAYRRNLESIRQGKGLRPIHGTADFFPNDLAEVFAGGAIPRLRPALQGYASYNSQLTGMNAAYLHGPRRPDSVLFDIDPIDHNYPALEDPLSVLAYLSCYEPTGFAGKYLLLGATICQEPNRQLFLDTLIAPGERVTVPSNSGPIWAEIEFFPRTTGELVQFVYHLPPAELVVETETQERKYRLTKDPAKAGFLLSPVLCNVVSFASLYGQDHFDTAATVRTMMVRLPFSDKRYYKETIHLRLYTLHVPERNIQRLLPPATLQFASSVRSQLGIHNSEPRVAMSPAWIINDGHAHIQVGASSEGDVQVNQEAHRLQAKFGVHNNCPEVISPWLRARFEILWMAGASPTTLFSKVAEFRGDAVYVEAISLALPGRPGRVKLRTEPEGGNCRSGVWWSDLDIQ